MSKEEKEYVIKEVLDYNKQIDEEKKGIIDNSVLLALHSLLIGLDIWVVTMSNNKLTTVLWCICCALNGVLAGLDVAGIKMFLNDKKETEKKYQEYIDNVDANVSVERGKDQLTIRVK